MDKMRSMMSHAGLAGQYWGDAMCQAAYLHNKTYSLITSIKSAHEILYKKAPNNSTIKVFGSRALVHKQSVEIMNKFECHAEGGLGMGSSGGIYIAFTPLRRVIADSKHVHYDETAFPMRRLSLKRAVFVDEEHDSPKGESSRENYSYIWPFKQGPRQTDESRLPQIHTKAVEGEVTNMNDVETTSTTIHN